MKENRIGIFGGAFDPIHYGHLNSMTTVSERLQLDKVIAIPSARGPLRPQTHGASPEQRLEMCQIGIQEISNAEVDRLEIDRGGVSYSIDTVKELEKKYPDAHFYLIIGLDQFGKFDEWKEYEGVLKRADLVVTSRPGSEFPYSVEKFPPGIRSLIEDFDGYQAMLKGSEHAIHFIRLQDVEASATDIRKKIRVGQNIQHLVPIPVEEYIRSKHLYESVSKNIGDFQKFTKFCADHLKEKGGIQIRGFDLQGTIAPCDYSLITSGTSTRHATALAESLVTEVKREYGVWPQSIEGTSEGRWIVVDYGALIIHSFYDYVRQEYRLEQLWKNGQELQL